MERISEFIPSGPLKLDIEAAPSLRLRLTELA
jgi:hypothetical protein